MGRRQWRHRHGRRDVRRSTCRQRNSRSPNGSCRRGCRLCSRLRCRCLQRSGRMATPTMRRDMGTRAYMACCPGGRRWWLMGGCRGSGALTWCWLTGQSTTMDLWRGEGCGWWTRLIWRRCRRMRPCRCRARWRPLYVPGRRWQKRTRLCFASDLGGIAARTLCWRTRRDGTLSRCCVWSCVSACRRCGRWTGAGGSTRRMRSGRPGGRRCDMMGRWRWVGAWRRMTATPRSWRRSWTRCGLKGSGGSCWCSTHRRRWTHGCGGGRCTTDSGPGTTWTASWTLWTGRFDGSTR